jgi:hypothetical protein
MDHILHFCALIVRRGRKVFEPAPQVLCGLPSAIDPDPRATMTTFAMVDVRRSANVSDPLLLMEQRLSFLDVLFLSSHAETPS